AVIGTMSDVVRLRPRGRREDTTSFIGMAIFLGAWGMTFAGLFFAYFDVRLSATEWPPHGEAALPLVLPAINTVLLLASSVTLALGLRAVRMARPEGLRRGLLVTLALGTVFVALQVIVWRQLLAHGLRWDSG